jgi:hypothetical protein
MLIHDVLGVFLLDDGLLNLRYIQEPFSKEINWVLGVGLVENSHAFCDDKA